MRTSKPSDTVGEQPESLGTGSQLEDLIRNLDAIVWEADPQSLRFSFISKRAEDLLGYPVERWRDEPDFFAGLIHPDDRTRAIEQYRGAVRAGTSHSFEYRVLAADGRTVWLRDRVHVAFDEQGRPRSLRGVMVDTTGRRAAEETLRDSEDRYRRLVHRSPDAILIHSGGKLVYANVSAAKLLAATSPQELIGRSALDIVHPDYRDLVLERIRSEEVGEAVPMIEEKFVRLDGSVVDVEVSGIPFTYEGKPAGQIVVRDITERKLTEGQLRETEARYRALVESIAAVLYIELPDTDGNTLYISPQIEDLLGFTPEQYLADPHRWQKVIHPDDLERARDDLESFIRTGQPEASDYRMIARDGRVVWIHDRARLIRDEDGNPSMIQGVMFDVTEHRLAEEGLKRRDAILEAIDFAAERFLGAPQWQDTIYEVLRALGEATQASRVYIFQARHDEVEGETYSSLLYEWTAPGINPVVADPAMQDRPLVANGLGRWGAMLDRDQVVHGPVRTFPETERRDLENENVLSILMAPIFVEQRRWGSIGFDDCKIEREWHQSEIEAVRAAAGTLGAAIERLGTEQQLRETEAKYRALVEQIPAILYIDEPGTDDNTIYISPQLEDILGLSAADWLSDSSLWYKHLHPDDRERAQLTYRKGVASGRPFSFEYRMETSRGVIWIRDEAVVLLQEDERPLVQGVMFDITEQKQAELALLASERREREAAQQLRDLDQMKNTFLAAVSHELRSPLTAVLGLALTMEHQDLETEDRNDLLARLVSNARKLERLLSDLLDIDRLARGVISPQLRRTDVGALVRRIAESSDAVNGRTLNIQTDAVVADVDSPKVERIVENLLVNAIRHTENATTVWVRAESNDGGVLIVVEDDGPGVPENIRTAIFEPFRQGETNSPHAPGTGIGLTLVSRFAELHGGRAWVEDRAGGGASFRVFLPTNATGAVTHEGTR